MFPIRFESVFHESKLGRASSWSDTGAASPVGIQIAMEEIRAELKLDVLPDPVIAFAGSFVQR